MPPKKYNTEEERKAAHREAVRKWNSAHRDKMNEAARKYNHKHGISKSSAGYEVLSAEDLDALSRAQTDMSARVVSEMDVDYTAEYKEQFKQMLVGHELTDELLDQAFKFVRSSSLANSKKGRLFEITIRKNILFELKKRDLKLYWQVPTNKRTCYIDFVISKQVCEDKRDLDLSQAVIISTKTGLGASWREDMHLYDRCQAYFMVTMNNKAPTEDVPPNVHFVSPHYKASDDSKILNLNDLLSTVLDYLDVQTVESESESATSTDSETEQDSDD